MNGNLNKKIKTKGWLRKYPICLLATFSMLVCLGKPARANSDTEEIGYDELINRINTKRAAVTKSDTRSFDNLSIHAGFGLLSAMNDVKINNKDSYRYQNGFLLALGIDLFSENFYAEGELRNFGQTTSGSETRSLRELDLKLCFKNDLVNRTGFHLGAGLGTRYMKLSDPLAKRNIEDTTPSFLLSGGIDSYLNKNLSLGFEVSWKTAMITNTIDKNSLDLGIRLDSHF
jgi:hypothetical protein